MSVQRMQHFPSVSAWRVSLLGLAIVLGLTNLIELAPSIRPGYWASVGTIGLEGTEEHDRLRIDGQPQAGTVITSWGLHDSAASLSIKPGDRLSVASARGVSGTLRFAPTVLEFSRIRPSEAPIELRIERGRQTTVLAAHHSQPVDLASQVLYYSQVLLDLIFAVVGGLLAWRRSADKAVRALAIAMICWASNIPSASDSPVFDVLFLINQLTARVWVEVLLVYWAIQLSPSSRWGIARRLRILWPYWAALTIALGLLFRGTEYYALPLSVDTLQAAVNFNQTLLYLAPLAALAEGVFSTQGEMRTRIRWGLFIFGLHFALFPLRIYVYPQLSAFWPSGLPSTLLDDLLQLVLPLGLLYATLRHRLLDLSFALNRGVVYGAMSLILVAAFFGLEKLSEGVLRIQGREQNALLAGGIAFGIFLFFDRVRTWVERNVERFLFSAWHRKELALREYVRSAAHVTRIEALVAGAIAAIDRFTDQAGCALYRRDPGGDYRCLHSSATRAPVSIDGNDPVILALRLERAAVRSADVGSSLLQDLALPILFRGEVDGCVILNLKPDHEAYRPDEIELLSFAVQQIGLDLTALEREQYQQQNIELAAQACSARSNADEMRNLLQLALGRQVLARDAALTPADGGAR